MRIFQLKDNIQCQIQGTQMIQKYAQILKVNLVNKKIDYKDNKVIIVLSFMMARAMKKLFF